MFDKKKLKIARQVAGLSRARAAELAGLTPWLIGAYERGLQEPRISQLFALADAYGVPASWLLTGRETVSRESFASALAESRRARESAAKTESPPQSRGKSSALAPISAYNDSEAPVERGEPDRVSAGQVQVWFRGLWEAKTGAWPYMGGKSTGDFHERVGHDARNAKTDPRALLTERFERWYREVETEPQPISRGAPYASFVAAWGRLGEAGATIEDHLASLGRQIGENARTGKGHLNEPLRKRVRELETAIEQRRDRESWKRK
jgi:transcriptional regulator with XRE-family HTH domain